MLLSQPMWASLQLSEVKRTCSKMTKAAKHAASTVPPLPPRASSSSTKALPKRASQTSWDCQAQKDGYVWAGRCASMIQSELLRKRDLDPRMQFFVLDLRVQRGKSVLMNPITKEYLEPSDVLAKAKLVPTIELRRVLVEDLQFGSTWAESQAAALNKAQRDWAAQHQAPNLRRERGSLKASDVQDMMVLLAVGDMPPANGHDAPPGFMHTTVCLHLSSLVALQEDAREARRTVASGGQPQIDGGQEDATEYTYASRSCPICAATDKLSACAQCGTVWYCTREHQKQHWKAGHKQSCKERQNLTELLAAKIHSMCAGSKLTGAKSARTQAMEMVSLCSDEEVVKRLTCPLQEVQEEERCAARLAFFESQYKNIQLAAGRSRCHSSLRMPESGSLPDVPEKYLPDSLQVKKEKGLRRTRAFMVDIDMSKVTEERFVGTKVWDLSDYRFILYTKPDDIEFRQHEKALKDLDPAHQFLVRITNDGRAPALLAVAEFS